MMVLPGGAAKCDWCDELFPEQDALRTEDGENKCCSQECLNSLEQNLEENKEQRSSERATKYQ